MIRKIIVLLILLAVNQNLGLSQEVIILKNKLKIKSSEQENYKFYDLPFISSHVDTVQHIIFLIDSRNVATIDNLACPCVKTLSIFQYNNQGNLIERYHGEIHLNSTKKKLYYIDNIDKLVFNPFFNFNFNEEGIITANFSIDDTVDIRFQSNVANIKSAITFFETVGSFLKKRKKYLKKHGLKVGIKIQ